MKKLQRELVAQAVTLVTSIRKYSYLVWISEEIYTIMNNFLQFSLVPVADSQNRILK